MTSYVFYNHHYKHKTVFWGVLVLVLGAVLYSDVVAQRAFDPISLPSSYEITTGSVEDSKKTQTGSTSEEPEPVDWSIGDAAGIKLIPKPETPTTGAVIMSGSMLVIATGQNQSGAIDLIQKRAKLITTYARKIETLIAIKGQETRSDMIIIMNKFLKKYNADNSLYLTIKGIMDIIILGDIAHKVENCTQYDDIYQFNLFGVPLMMHSTIRYSRIFDACEVTYEYPDQSVHTCRLNDEQKLQMAKMLRVKQDLDELKSKDTFEGMLETLLTRNVCFESKGVAEESISGSSISDNIVAESAPSVWWRFGR